MIKVSIIILVYNTEQYLEKCLNSVINQTLKEIEIICIDDKSTDNSINIIKEFQKKDNRIILIESEKNMGMGYNRDVGIKQAKGEYIGFVDSDDYLELDGLEVLSNIIMQNDLPAIIIANSSNHVTKDSLYTYKQAFFKQDADTLLSYKDILQDFPHIHFYVVWLFTCRCDFLLQNNFRFEPNIIYEDVLFTSYVFIFSESIYISNIPIYNYRISRENSIMNTKTKEHFYKSAYSHFMLSKRFFEFCEDNNDEMRKNYFMHWGIFYLKETLRHLQRFGYIDEFGFSKSELRVLYPYLRGKYKFCFHFHRIYGFPKRLRLFIAKLFRS